MSATSPSSVLGQCVVCGKESTTACSVCKNAGLDWMLFCSKEHQRLIWKVHKRVCGKNPFEWPPLTDQELEEAWEIRNSPLFEEYPAGTVLRSAMFAITDAMVQARGVQGDGVHSARELIYKSNVESLQVNTHDPFKQTGLKIHRKIIIQAKSTALHNDHTGLEKLKTFSEDPVGFMTWVQGTFPDIVSNGFNTRWSSELQHRTLIFFSLVGVHLEQFFETKILVPLEDDLFIKHSESVLIELGGAGGISGVNPDRAREIVENFINEVLRTAQIRVRPVLLRGNLGGSE
ncbi:hypothetical protein JCM5350_008321 [Sporobolomyces pararoseus]